MGHMWVAAALIMLSLTIPLDATAGCLTPRPAPVLTDAHSYMSAFISSLWQAKQAGAREDLSPAKTIGELLLQYKRGQEDYRCAASLVVPFTNSSDETIGKVARIVVQAYDTLIELNNRSIAETVALLDRAGTQADGGVGSYLDKLASNRVGKEQMWELLMAASGAGRHVLVKFTLQGEGTGRLRITTAQRRDLLKQLEQEFGPTARTGPKPDKAGTIDVAEGSANILYSFLADKAWKSTDD